MDGTNYGGDIDLAGGAGFSVGGAMTISLGGNASLSGENAINVKGNVVIDEVTLPALAVAYTLV